MLCNAKLNQPLAYTHHTDIEEALLITKCVHFLFPEWFCFEKDPVRGHVSPASTRVLINR